MTRMSEECLRWDERYASHRGLFFGGSATPLVVDTLARLSTPPEQARALCLGEGEGRDALFLARAGLHVDAVDGSRVGLDTLRERAASEGGEVRAIRADLERHSIEAGRYDLIVSCYCHLRPGLRRRVHADAARGLRPGGLLVIEGFSVGQLEGGFRSGGPRDPQMLWSAAELRADVEDLVEIELLFEGEVEIDLGRHRGPAVVTRLRGRAPRGSSSA